MNISDLAKKKVTPFLLILLGLIALAVYNQPIIAGACLVIGISMVIDRIVSWIWPDK